MDIEPVFWDCEGNGERGWESDGDQTSIEFNDESNPQGPADCSPGSPRRSGVPLDSSPVSSYRSHSPSPTNPYQAKEKTKVVASTRDQLRDCLENIHDGQFATSGALPNAANPGIFLPSLGTVGLPMSDRDAELIIGIAHEDQNQADHPGSSVSPPAGSCELDPSQFEIRNPLWQQILTEAVEKTAKALKIKRQTASVKAEITKLRICCPGDSVDDHQQ